MAENIIAQIIPDKTDSRKLVLKINVTPIVKWIVNQVDNSLHYISEET